MKVSTGREGTKFSFRPSKPITNPGIESCYIKLTKRKKAREIHQYASIYPCTILLRIVNLHFARENFIRYPSPTTIVPRAARAASTRLV